MIFIELIPDKVYMIAMGVILLNVLLLVGLTKLMIRFIRGII